jgi:hypothetical protein
VSAPDDDVDATAEGELDARERGTERAAEFAVERVRALHPVGSQRKAVRAERVRESGAPVVRLRDRLDVQLDSERERAMISVEPAESGAADMPRNEMSRRFEEVRALEPWRELLRLVYHIASRAREGRHERMSA